MRRTAFITLLAMAATSSALSQKPVINGVVNAASRQACPPYVGCSFTAGSLAVLQGENFAPAQAKADATPLPNTLAGTSVLIDGRPVPLLSVAPTEILFQIPNYTMSPTAGRPLMVRALAGDSQPLLMHVSYFGVMGIFSRDGTGCGVGLAFNLESAGNETFLTENTAGSSAQPDGIITLFGTGIAFNSAFENDMPKEGIPSPSDLIARMLSPVLYSGDRGGAIGTTLFAGRAPGLIGVDQINVRLARNAPQGCDIPVWLSWRLSHTQEIPLSIRRGGGPCLEPPTTGKILWRKTISSGLDVPEMADSLDVAIASSPFPADLVPVRWGSLPTGNPPQSFANPFLDIPYRAVRCGIDRTFRHLRIDELRLRPEGSPPATHSLDPIENGEGYRGIDLSPGAIHPGRFGISIEDAVLGAGSSEIRIPEPIRITSDLRPGTVLGAYRPPGFILNFPIRWEGGDPDSAVMIMAHRPNVYAEGRTLAKYVYSWSVPAKQGVFNLSLNTMPGIPFEIEIWNYREGGGGELMNLPGLSAPLQHGWRYVWRFGGLLTSVVVQAM
jgi:uncharacterized protein (TIGR03437 family)